MKMISNKNFWVTAGFYQLYLGSRPACFDKKLVFHSSLAFSHHGDRQLVPVLNKSYNNKNGPSRGKLVFQFFHFNKLIRVYIDDILPTKQITKIGKKGEFWVALCEKAYAKLLGSYEIQDGGWPRYSFYHLTCGIPIDVYFKDYSNQELPQIFAIMKDIMENNPEVVWARVEHFLFWTRSSKNESNLRMLEIYITTDLENRLKKAFKQDMRILSSNSMM